MPLALDADAHGNQPEPMNHPASADLDHVVVIGASAGGLEPLRELASHLPRDAKAAYVVAQHLAPERPSQLVDLLARTTPLKVAAASNGSQLKAGEMLVVPPGSDAAINADRLRLTAPQPPFRPSPSVDQLFDSLAEAWGPKAVAIVLSGTGSDGALGLRAVGAAGGLTFVQSPESARFDGMPRAAMALGRADWVSEPAAIGARLVDCFGREGGGIVAREGQSEAGLLGQIAAELKRCTGIDFSQYKDSTVRRQLLRRMAVCGAGSLPDYLTLLADDAQECKALAQNLLVSVTAFFRNPEAFAALSEHLKPLLERIDSNEKLRVWVPGCATGEEAYSIGMIISEAMGHPSDLNQKLKIFATDLDEQSLSIGRRGVYPISAAKAIPAELQQRFLVDHDSEMEINKELRSCLIFARHNVSEEPPFPSIDLISFRNTLIYFTAPLQERVIDFFNFSLAPGGLLFLGSSESLGRKSGFTILNPLYRIYQRSPDGRTRRRITPASPLQRAAPLARTQPASNQDRDEGSDEHVALMEALLRTIGRPCLVLDESHNLVEVVGDVSPYCRIPEGRMTASAGTFLRQELQSEARALFLLVRADRTSASSRPLLLPGLSAAVRMEAAPLQLGERALTVLSFISEAGTAGSVATEPGNSERDAAFAREIERLERELLANQETLRRSISDLEQVNEELEASTEELQASSEELQSSNEELEASNEELQATNEELGTLNQQLRIRSEELERLNNDLENIQSSLNQGMVIVDRNLRITRYSPLAVRVFGLLEQDIGQPLIGVPTTVPLPHLREAMLAVLGGEEHCSIEASSEEVSYLAQVMPYRDKEGVRLGAIITLTDVSELVALRRAAEASLREFSNLTEALEQAVWKRDHTMRQILYLSRRIEPLTGWSAAELCSNPALLDGAIVAADRARVEAARSSSGSGWSITYRLIDRRGQERAVHEVATVVDESHEHYIVGTLCEVTQQSQLQQRNQLLASGFEALLASAGSPLALVDPSLQIVGASTSFAELLHHDAAELKDLPLQLLCRELAPDGGLLDAAQQLLLQPPATLNPKRELIELATARGTRLALALVPLVAGQQVLGILLELHPQG
jgi:two-component system CheB/CheR fusion protein